MEKVGVHPQARERRAGGANGRLQQHPSPSWVGKGEETQTCERLVDLLKHILLLTFIDGLQVSPDVPEHADEHQRSLADVVVRKARHTGTKHLNGNNGLGRERKEGQDRDCT